MKAQPQVVPCWCGRGCKGRASASDPRDRSERDTIARYLALHGPMPVWAEGAHEGLPPGQLAEPLYWIESADDPRLDDPVPTQRKVRQQQADADPVAKARQAEAMEWVKAYTGSWGLILDIRADQRWGTKYMRLSPRQVEVILAAKARDAERAVRLVQDPAQAEAVSYLRSIPEADLRADAARGFDFEQAMLARADQGLAFTDNQLAAINRCRARRAPRQASPQVTEIGMYRADDGTVYKVQAARQSGHLYAKRLAVHGPGSATFEFEQGAIRKLRPEHRMTVEDAAAFGHQFGVCAVCGATLTDPESVERGIGPVCAGRV